MATKTKKTKTTKPTANTPPPAALAAPGHATTEPPAPPTPPASERPLVASIRRAEFCPLCAASHAHLAYYFKLWLKRPVKTDADVTWLVEHARRLAHEALAVGR